MPWQYKIVVVASSFFIMFVIIYIPLTIIKLRSVPKELAIESLRFIGGQKPPGMLDPSLAYDPQNEKIWMAYTAEEKSSEPSTDPGQSGKTLNVRLASSQPEAACRRWRQASVAFDGKNDNIFAPDGQTVLRSGTWRIETPALVYDPDDPGREWKLYAYKYFWANDPKSVMQVAQHYGMIVYKYAADPDKEWSPEQWLFSPSPNYPPPPYDSLILLNLNRLDPALQNVVAYARPSVVYKDGALVMTLSAFTGDMTPDRIIMIVSLDHGNSWRYVGTVLQQSDLSGLGAYTRLAGATLIEQGSQVYLAAALGNEQQRGQGTFIFGFDDFGKGLLLRDPKTGALSLLHQIPLPKPGAGSIGGGAAAYSDACASGIMITEQTGNNGNFDIYHTGIKPIEKQ